VIPTAARADADALAGSHPLDEGCPVADQAADHGRVLLNLGRTRRSS